MIYDGGRTFIMFDNMDIGQFYAVTVDNRDPYHIYGGLQDSGNWGGVSNSRDYNGILGEHWFKFHSVMVSTPPSIPTTGPSSIPRPRTAACAGWMRSSGRPAPR